MVPRSAFACLLIWAVAAAAIATAGPDRLQSLTADLRRRIAGLEAEVTRLHAENALLRRRLGIETTPPIVPFAPRPAASPWLCETCGRVITLEVNGRVRASHVDGFQDHPAKLSREDMKTIADGLRMRD